MARIPVYPKIVRDKWKALIAGIDMGRPPDFRTAAFRLYRLLSFDENMKSALIAAFEDVVVASAFSVVEANWPVDKLDRAIGKFLDWNIKTTS